MAEVTSISWCDATFNPWHGCQKVGPGCDHCYAERDAKRFAAGRVLWGAGSERRTFGDKHWQAPRDWARTMPAKLGRRPRVFCASMGDWLDLDAPLDQFVRLLDTIRLTPELDWMLLSKRIGNWRKRLTEASNAIPAGLPIGFPIGPDLLAWVQAWLDGNAPHNVWLGATVVNQEEADRDIPKLLATPARVRFLSIEPMLGDIRLGSWLQRSPSAAFEAGKITADMPAWTRIGAAAIDWVICGGESGPHARPMHPDWVRSLRDQCAATGVAFHFKQWGEWWEVNSDSRDEETGDHNLIDVPGIEAEELFDPKTDRLVAPDGRVFASLEDLPEDVRCRHMTRLGKKAAGRHLDGRTHDGFPPC